MYISSWQGLNPIHLLPGALRSGLLPFGGARELVFPMAAPHKAYFYVARNAIYHLFRALNLRPDDVVLAPDYHSGNEVWAMQAAGASLRYYHIRRNTQPDLDELDALCREHRPRVLYVIHYLGWPQPLPDLKALCDRYGMLLIEDCALAMLSELEGRPLGSTGEYSIFCLYKTLAVPNGGVLVQNGRVFDGLERLELCRSGRRSEMGRVLELLVEWFRARADKSGNALAWLKAATGRALDGARVARVPVGDIGFDIANVNIGMSALCERLLGCFDYADIVKRRRANYTRMQEKLEGRATLLFPKLEDGVCPLFFPVLVPDKKAAAEALWARNICAVQFWNCGDPAATGSGFEDATYLRRHVLELPIHQDVGPAQVDYIAEQVARLLSFKRTVALTTAPQRLSEAAGN